MRFIPGLVLILLVSSCSSENEQKEPFRSLLNPCTEANIVLYNEPDVLNFKTTDSAGLKILREMITGEIENIPDTCMPMGDLYFLNGTDSVLKVQFSAKQIGDKEVCNYLAYTFNGNSFKHKLSDKGKMLLMQLRPKP